MKPYIDLNTRLRTESKDEFGVTFYNFANNAVFGKQMENVRARSGVKVVSGESERGKKKLRKLICNPRYKSSKVFANSGGLVSVNMRKASVVLNKPIAVSKLY